MLAWFAANLINIVLILAVALLVFVLVRSLIRDKKAGRTCAGCKGCGGGCGSCSSCGKGTAI